MLDEEEYLVQFAHHTVKEYLLSDSSNPLMAQFHFRLSDVDHAAGEVCCTYLQFNDFKRQLVQAPKNPVMLEPKFILKNSLSMSGSTVVAKSWLRMERLWKSRRVTDNSQVWRQLHFLSMGNTPVLLQRLQTQYTFLAYASEYWLSHTTNFRPEISKSWDLWANLAIDDNALAAKPWVDIKGNSSTAFGKEIQEYITRHDHCALLILLTEISVRPRGFGRLELWIAKKGSVQLLEIILAASKSQYSTVEDLPTEWFELFENAVDGRQSRNVRTLLFGQGPLRDYRSWATLFEYKDQYDHDVLESERVRAERVRACVIKAVTLYSQIGDIDSLKFLLKIEASFTGAPPGVSELQTAAAKGDLVMVSRLLAADVDPNCPPALYAAAEKGHVPIVSALLAAGAQVDGISDADGRTALLAATAGGHEEVIYLLLVSGADVDKLAGYRFHGNASWTDSDTKHEGNSLRGRLPEVYRRAKMRAYETMFLKEGTNWVDVHDQYAAEAYFLYSWERPLAKELSDAVGELPKPAESSANLNESCTAEYTWPLPKRGASRSDNSQTRLQRALEKESLVKRTGHDLEVGRKLYTAEEMGKCYLVDGR